ncbi:hypothetical protein, partial [Aeromonas caviae]|uniref:hypothetical protein n=1 Tax=Aeromonas caviae TaxID=648 RepID=UPI004039A91A
DRPSRTTPTCSRQCFDQRSALDIEVAAHRRLRHAAIVAALDGGMSKAAVCRNFNVKRTTLIETLTRAGWRG